MVSIGCGRLGVRELGKCWSNTTNFQLRHEEVGNLLMVIIARVNLNHFHHKNEVIINEVIEMLTDLTMVIFHKI